MQWWAMVEGNVGWWWAMAASGRSVVGNAMGGDGGQWWAIVASGRSVVGNAKPISPHGLFRSLSPRQRHCSCHKGNVLEKSRYFYDVHKSLGTWGIFHTLARYLCRVIFCLGGAGYLQRTDWQKGSRTNTPPRLLPQPSFTISVV